MNRARRAAPKPTGKPLWYLDESEIELLPVKGPGYGARGAPLRVDTPGENEKEHLFLAANWWTGKIHYRFYPLRRSEQYHDFEQRLRREGPMGVGLDNSNIHFQKAARVPAEGVERLFLPTYAWWLMPVEDIFGWVKGELTNLEAKDMRERKGQVRRLLKRLQNNPRKVLRLMGNKEALKRRSSPSP